MAITESAFKFNLLDGCRLFVDGIEISGIAKRPRAILAFMLLSANTSYERSDLCALIWPDKDLKRARGSLRQTIHEIRSKLEQFSETAVVGTADSVLIDQSQFSSDLDEHFSKLSQGKYQIEAIRKATADRFLSAGLGNVSEEFSDWVNQFRSRTKQRILEGLLSISLDQENDLRDRLGAARLGLEIDTYSEEFVRSHMEILVAKGEAAKAISVYDTFYVALGHQIDAEPSLETQDLAVKIKTLEATPAPTALVPASSTLADTSMVAILPFDMFGPKSLPSYFFYGLLEEITCTIAGLSSPGVISSNSTRQYLGKFPDITQVGRALGAQYVVTGSVSIQNLEAKVTFQVVHTNSRKVERARVMRFDAREIIFKQSDIAAFVTSTVVPSLQFAELRRTAATPDHELEPFHLYLRAREKLFELTTTSFQRSGALLQELTKSAPYFAQGHALLAEWHCVGIWQGWTSEPKTSALEAERLLQHAITMNGEDARSLALLAHNHVSAHRRYSAADLLFTQAIELMPNDADTQILSVPSLAFTEKATAGIERGERAIALSPQDPFLFRNLHFLSIANYAEGDLQRTIELAKRTKSAFATKICENVIAKHSATRDYRTEITFV